MDLASHNHGFAHLHLWPGLQPSPSSGPLPESDFPRYPPPLPFDTVVPAALRLLAFLPSLLMFLICAQAPQGRVCLFPAVLLLFPAPASGPLHFLSPLPELLLPQNLYHFFLASDPMIPQQAACPCLPQGHPLPTSLVWFSSPRCSVLASRRPWLLCRKQGQI